MRLLCLYLAVAILIGIVGIFKIFYAPAPNKHENETCYMYSEVKHECSLWLPKTPGTHTGCDANNNCVTIEIRK